ncbi:DUF2029 domain-containing protein [Nocardia sp. NEAU-G5]|uniref:DUF2029 domain-containing protein n=1 Tax=Nocardia albiluteola TaxID=2842303 RepID=A0ABS6AQX0_9NOCA|nr:glycosyltransferase 87 family protein [Nocardia albiluteola]MBU3059941.1 DUF2029 domain-containing protein [Nocardia albiluteola]
MSKGPGTRVRLPGPGRAAAATAVLVCGATLVLAYLNKARCAGAPYRPSGRSIVFDRIKDSQVCYSDIQFLWLGRGVNLHLFPYLTGGITPTGKLVGSVVEYPVLTGMLMWLGGVGAHTDAAFLLHSALLLAPFGLAVAWMLGRLSGRAALLWAGGPPLVLYAFHNWELPVVCTAVTAVYVVTVPTRYSVRARGVVAAVLLGIGCCLKLYPGIFVLPLLIHVLVGGSDGLDALAHARRGASSRRYDVPGALAVAGAAIVTVVAINLPFAVAGYRGWQASFSFQESRQADITTNSVWYWGFRAVFGAGHGAQESYTESVAMLSPVLVLAAGAVAIWLGWRRYQASGLFGWVGVSGAMLCGFLLFHKVHSPQYTLWLLPFLVLLEVPWAAVVAYLVADAAVGIGIFRYFHALATDSGVEFARHLVQFGVWGRAVLLVYLFYAFVYAPPRGSRALPPLPAPSRADDELVSITS